VFVRLATLLLFCGIHGFGQTHSPFPVDITFGPPPQPVAVNGRLHLVYEIHLTSFGARPTDLLSLDVLGDNQSRPLATFSGDALQKIVWPAGARDEAANTRSVASGGTVIVFLDIPLPAGTHAPAVLHHRFKLSITIETGPIESTFDAPSISVVQNPAPLVGAPLSGTNWVAENALAAVDHRRAFVAIDGKEYIAQRFAIDWVRIGPDRRLVHDDPKSNKNYYGYGAEVLAVANARVASLKDGLPEYSGTTERSERKITIENVLGNYIVLDLGDLHFAVYAHLQPGSISVKVGDKVTAGQPMARLGNSGNSDAPHLHFQVVNGNSPLASEGVPYSFETFTQTGIAENADEAAVTDAYRTKTETPPSVHRGEFPVNNAIVTFP
jgi:murein DD-endopeptidase